MHIHSYHLRNYRRLKDVRVDLDCNISILVGANNSGKTSATQALDMFLSGQKSRFSIYDFSSHLWKGANEIGAADPAGDETAILPFISLDLWFEVSEHDLHLVLPILPSTAWVGTQVGMRIVFGPKNSAELLKRFRDVRAEGLAKSAALPDGGGSYVPWPRDLTDYLERELQNEFEFSYFVLDRAQFDANFKPAPDYEPAAFAGEVGGAATLKSLVRVDCLNAQRHLADPSPGTSASGRAEDLSRRLSRFYQRNLEQRAEDHSALRALFESEEGLNRHLSDVFAPTLKRIAKLGYPGLSNPRLEIKSSLNPATVMSQDAKVNYLIGDGEAAVRLPDSYNGLGFKNLIYMVVEILDLQEKWRLEEEGRAPLHLIFIEEPEAHLHAQLQQVFIRNVLDLLKIPGEDDGAYKSQVVVTTHSPHILYERGFAPIRYFRRHAGEGEQSTQVLNLSAFQAGDAPKDRDFLQRYLKLTHCDLFFADAVILVEGNVERLLLPSMIEKEAVTLRSVSLCILEVGGAFGHRFKELIEFLGITTLIVTDIDSVAVKTAEPVEGDEDEDAEVEIPATEAGAEPVKKKASTCLPSVANAMTANQTLAQWLPEKLLIAELWEVAADDKARPLLGTDKAMVRVAYQVPTDVTWNGATQSLCGRTLEEAFGLENADWCQSADQKFIGLKLRAAPADAAALAEGLHNRVTGKSFDKTRFALGVLASPQQDWIVPFYIREGLIWLRDKVDLEILEEVDAVAEAATAIDEAPTVNAGEPA